MIIYKVIFNVLNKKGETVTNIDNVSEACRGIN